MKLKNVVQRKLASQNDAKFAALIQNCEDKLFEAVVIYLFEYINPSYVALLKAGYGIGEERKSYKRIAEDLNLGVQLVSVRDKIQQALNMLTHPMNMEVLRDTLLGSPFPPTGTDRPVTVLRLDTRALTGLHKARFYRLEDLASCTVYEFVAAVSDIGPVYRTQIREALIREGLNFRGEE